MAKIILSTDSACDLTKDIIEKYDINVIPILVILGDKEFEDGINIEPNNIYAHVDKTGQLPKTAAPSIEIFKEYFLKLAKNGNTVLHISISSRISACYQNAKLAAQEVKNVHIIDSYALSTGASLLILKAHDLIKSGKSIEEIILELEKVKFNVNTSFVIDRLEYLYKGGRCNGLALLGANLLKIHPMALMQNGYLKSFKKFKGSMKVVLSNYLDFLAENFGDYDNTRAFITNTEMDVELLNMVKETVKVKFQFKEILETMAGSTITGHCGKNTLGLLYITNKNIPI